MPYLMDEIAQFANMVRKAAGDEPIQPLLKVYPDIASKLHWTPRYLLDNDAIQAAVEIALGRPKIMLEALAHIQVPYDSMWIEWAEEGREALRSKLYGPDSVPAYEAPGRPLPKRVGFLIESERGGRKGCVTWVWNGPVEFAVTSNITPPNVAAIEQRFDLDHPGQDGGFSKRQAFLTANLCSFWKSSPVQVQALTDLWATADHRVSEWGAQFLIESTARGGISLRSATDHALADVYGEYIMVWAILLLLTSSRRTVDYHKVDRAKLNKARIKHRRTPLLDHVEVTMHIGDRQMFRGQRTLDFRRKSPRIHMVSRYLARRGNKHWIVEPYLRGSGDPASLKTIHVKE